MKEDINSMTRRIRVVTGLVLFIYTSTHLLNHSVATISIQAADAVREYFLLAWRNPVAEIILFLSIAVHIILGILAVIRKRSAKMTKVEWVQILFPFIALFVLLQHIVTAALLSRIFGVDDSYELIFCRHAGQSGYCFHLRAFLYADDCDDMDTWHYRHTRADPVQALLQNLS